MYIIVGHWNVRKSMMRILTTGWPVKNGYALDLTTGQQGLPGAVSIPEYQAWKCLITRRHQLLSSTGQWSLRCFLLSCQSLLSVVLLPWLTSQCWLLSWRASHCCLLSWRAFEWVYSHGSFVLITGRNLDWPYPGALPKREPCCIVRNLK